MAVWGSPTNSCEKKRSEKPRRKGKIQASECRVPKNSKEEIEENNRMGKTRDLLKLEVPREHFMQRWAR